MKRPCFDLWERIALKEGDARMMQRFQVIKAGRNFDRHLLEYQKRHILPILKFISNILTKFNY